MEIFDHFVMMFGMDPTNMPAYAKIMTFVVPLFVIVFYGHMALKKIINTGSAIRNIARGMRVDKNAGPSPDELRKIAVGALYASQQGGYVNTLRLDINKVRLSTILGEWWGITNREEAVATINYLASAPSATTLPIVLAAIKAPDMVEREKIVNREIGDDGDKKERAMSQIDNYFKIKNELVSDGLTSSPTTLLPPGVMAWDAGRLNFIARASMEKGYISERECRSAVDAAYEMARSAGFKDWREFAASYMLGRGLWGGNLDMSHLAEELLTKPDSPWAKVTWQAK